MDFGALNRIIGYIASGGICLLIVLCLSITKVFSVFGDQPPSLASLSAAIILPFLLASLFVGLVIHAATDLLLDFFRLGISRSGAACGYNLLQGWIVLAPRKRDYTESLLLEAWETVKDRAACIRNNPDPESMAIAQDIQGAVLGLFIKNADEHHVSRWARITSTQKLCRNLALFLSILAACLALRAEWLLTFFATFATFLLLRFSIVNDLLAIRYVSREAMLWHPRAGNAANFERDRR